MGKYSKKDKVDQTKAQVDKAKAKGKVDKDEVKVDKGKPNRSTKQQKQADASPSEKQATRSNAKSGKFA